ncbi:Panacea domain-containing protein [Pectobacterium carotovorum]|uniref:Panacea domain-containing protein n=1 Tax=Pectobacterium carotovorum TaxID=554 RepID=UPI0020BEC954|nr:type II toxin-antitoxin system antitoxin SocA domain-containing protein [Pectobacterium carotovorum]
MYSSEQLANKFIELGISTGNLITPMQAQKLTYIAHGISLGHSGIKLLDEPVCAWRYGPVIPSLYHALKHHGSEGIHRPVPDSAFFFAPPSELEEYANNVVNLVHKTYARYSGQTLSEFTHRTGTPWQRTYAAGESIIDDQLIKDYYQRLMAKDPACIGL